MELFHPCLVSAKGGSTAEKVVPSSAFRISSLSARIFSVFCAVSNESSFIMSSHFAQNSWRSASTRCNDNTQSVDSFRHHRAPLAWESSREKINWREVYLSFLVLLGQCNRELHRNELRESLSRLGNNRFWKLGKFSGLKCGEVPHVNVVRSTAAPPKRILVNSRLRYLNSETLVARAREHFVQQCDPRLLGQGANVDVDDPRDLSFESRELMIMCGEYAQTTLL